MDGIRTHGVFFTSPVVTGTLNHSVTNYSLVMNHKGCIILQMQFNGKGTSALFHTVFKCLSQPHFPRQPLLPIAPERLFTHKTQNLNYGRVSNPRLPPEKGAVLIP